MNIRVTTLVVLLATAASSAHSQTNWTLAGSGSYSQASNWSAGVPAIGGGTDVGVTNGTSGDFSIVNVAGGTTAYAKTLTLGSYDIFNLTDNSALNLYGNLSGTGVLGVNAGPNVSILGLVNSLTFNAGTTVSLAQSAGGKAIIQQQAGGVTLTNNGLIQGAGTVGNGGLALSNGSTGVINANASGQTLLLNASASSNAGLLTASNGGTLSLSAVTVANSGAITANGGSVLFGNSVINGGTLTSTNSGTLSTVPGYLSTLNGVTLTSGSTYTTGDNTALVIGGGIVNHGNVAVTAGNNISILSISSDGNLSGGGTVTLSATGSGEAIIEQQSGSLTLHNVDNVIQGFGTIGNGGLTFDNQVGGTVDANVSGKTLVLNGGGGVTNSGVLTATNGGNLTLDAVNVANNTAISANGGNVALINTTINGGALSTSGGGTMQTAGGYTATLNGVTLTSGSTYTTGDNTGLYIGGGLVNRGTVDVTAGNNASILGLTTTGSLTGGGTVTLSATGSGTATIQQEVGGVTLHNVDNVIQGFGTIGNGGLTLDNQAGGTVEANVSGQTLLLNAGGGVTNSGVLTATHGGNLTLDAVNVANNTAISANGGNVALINTTINGGTLSTSAGGTMHTVNGYYANLNGVTLASGSTYTTGDNTGLYIGGGLVNQGTVAVTAGNNISILGLSTTGSLTGGGTVTLSATGAGTAIIQQQVGGVTLHNVDNVIQGFGTIGNGGLALDNQAGGTVEANVSGQTLLLNAGGGVTNSGVLTATNGGNLTLDAVNVANNTAISANGGNVALINTTINGGTLSTSAGGTMHTVGGNFATLNGVTLASGSTYTTGDNTGLYIGGGLVNQGTVAVTAGNNVTTLGLTSSGSFTGGGTVTLSATGSGTAVIQQQVGGLTLHNVDNVIQGSGVIGNGGLALDNQAGGTVDANVSGKTLLLNGGGGVTNSGVLTATNGGNLLIQGITVTNNSAISANGGNVYLSNATIDGGTLTTGNGGTMQTAAGNVVFFNDVTLSSGSTYTSGDNTGLSLDGTITLNGNLQATNSGNSTIVALRGATTLAGTGSLTLYGTNSGATIVEQVVGGLTLENQSTIQGAGIIGNGGLALHNASNGQVLANAAGSTLVVNGSGGFVNDGTVKVSSGSSLQISGAPFTQDGGATVVQGAGVLDASTIAVSDNGGTIQVDGQLRATTVNVGNAGTLSGTGVIVSSVTNDGRVILGDSVLSPGSLTVLQNFTQAADGTLFDSIGASDSGLLTVDGNLALGGTLDISLLGGFTPTNGEVFDLANYLGTETGTFSGIQGTDAADWTVLYNPGQVDLQYNAPVQQGVPDAASTVLLLMAGLLVMGVCALFKPSWAR